MEAKDGATDKASKTVTVCIDASKRETHHGGSGFKKLLRRLKSVHSFKVINNKEDLSAKLLSSVDIVLIGAPRDKFSSDELEDIKRFIAQGGSLAFMSCEGGEPIFSHTNGGHDVYRRNQIG